MRKLVIYLFVFMILILLSCKSEEKVTVKTTKTILNETTSQEVEQTNEIKCNSDEDCGGRIVKNPYCFQGNSFGELIINKCINGGTPKSYCSQEVVKGLVQECAENQFCKLGECRNYENCTDSDGGKNYAVKGTVKTNDGATYDDLCKSDTVLVEYYCSSDNRAFSEIKNCDCKDDRCV